MEALHRNICFECNYHLNIEYGKTSVILPQMEGKKERKPIQQKQKAGIVTSLNDTTLTKVTYGKYATWVPDEVAYGIYEWFGSQ